MNRVREEGEPLQAGSGDLSRVDRLRPANQLPEIVPIECGGIVELRHEGFRIERVARLPELEHDEAADERSIKGSGRKDTEVVGVACFAALIASPDFLGDDLGQRQACYVRRVERQVPEVALNALSVPRRGKSRHPVAADLEPDLALTVRVFGLPSDHGDDGRAGVRVPGDGAPAHRSRLARRLSGLEARRGEGEAAQALPSLRDGETARLRDPEIEDKETRPPPRYREGTLIEAMQNAWRFVEDEALRERLREGQVIGTPATRAEIISGLKKQGFLTAQGKNIVPTDGEIERDGIVPGVRVGTRPERTFVRCGSGGFTDAASDSLRKQGSGVQHGRPIRSGWLVRAARHGS